MPLKTIRPGRATATRRPSMVLLHAFPLDASMWAEIIPALEDRIDVVAVQLPGTAGQPLDPENPPGIAEVAEQVRATLTDLGVGEAILVGCSMGGYVAFEAWRSWPHRVAGMVLVNTRADADDDAARMRREGVIRRVETEGASFLLDSIPETLLSPHTMATRPATIEAVQAMVQTIPGESVIALQRMLMARPDSIPTLRTIRVPTWVVAGEDDRVVPPATAEEMAKATPGARLITVPKAGHLLPMEAPDPFIKILHKFLDAMGAAQLQRLGLPNGG